MSKKKKNIVRDSLVAIEFNIQSRWCSEKKNEHYPLLHVKVEELKNPVVTMTGALGFAVQAVISYPETPTKKGRTVTANTVWHPSDRYSFSLGAKIALRRALDEWNAKKYTRKQAFRGLMIALEQFEGTKYDCLRPGIKVAEEYWEEQNV